MPERALPLSQCDPVVSLSYRPCGVLLQYHAWPDRCVQMAEGLAAHCGLPEAPRPSEAACGTKAALLRIHPQRLWLLAEDGAADHPQMGADVGAALNLSHARTIIHVDERIAVPLLSRFIAVDLRPHRFAVDHIALTPLHRVGVVLWRRVDGFDILAPRSFARSIWEVLAESVQSLA